MVDLLQLDASPSVDGTAYKATDSMKQAIIDYHLGGVYLTKENIKSQKQTKKLVQNLQASVVSGSALYVAVEEDGGGENSISAKVEDLKDTGYVTPKEMGQNMTANQIYESGKIDCRRIDENRYKSESGRRWRIWQVTKIHRMQCAA